MQKQKAVVLFLFFGALYFNLLSQTYTYKFFSAADGLPSSEIIALAKDANGFLWVGTAAGISKYDGYAFHNYIYSKTNDLIGYVNVLKVDDHNRLWIGSGAGLFCYTNNEIIKVSAHSDFPQGVNNILLEKDGTMWLATENGPAAININTVDLSGKTKILLENFIIPQWFTKKEAIDTKRVTIIARAADGTLYLAQFGRLYSLYNNELKLVYTVSEKNDRILSVFPVSKTKVFFDGSFTEINQIENGIWKNIYHEILIKPHLGDSLNGIWYLGSYGIYCFHPETGSASQFINTLDRGVLWPSEMLKDDDLFWVASHDGLLKIKPSLFTVYDVNRISPAHPDFYSFLHLQNGKFLLGTNRGKIFEKIDTGFSLVKTGIVPTAEIRCMYQNTDGSIWAGSGYQGLALLSNNAIKVFTEKNGLHDNSINNFFTTRTGRLYAIGDHGLSEVINENNKTFSFKKYYYESSTTQHAKFFAGIEAPDGAVWIGGQEGLVYLRNDSLHNFSIDGKQLSVNYIIKDNDETVWIAAAGEGILKCRFNKKNVLEIVQQITDKDGLNTLHYLTLLADKENNIWAGSSMGLSFIGQTGKYKDRVLNFDHADGFINPGYTFIRLYQDKNGIIWAGTIFGFASFNPAELLLTAVAPIVHITAVRQIKTNEIVSDTISDHQFNYDNNSFNFSFTALDYANQDGMRYFYRLSGLDSNWKNSEGLRSVSYENLSPGKYTFSVRALNSKGNWSTKNVSFTFIITPPFWKQWWFIATLCIVAAGIIYLYIKRREKFITEKEKQKTEIQTLKAGNYQYQFEMTQVINYFASSINQQNNIDDLLWDVAKNCIARLGFEDCVIYLKNTERNVLVQKAAWGPKTTTENYILNPIEITLGKGIVGSVAQSGKAEMINNTALDKRYIIDDALRLSEITVPIINNGEVIGVIDSENPQQNFYTERHLQILTTIASLCADKMDKIKAEQQTREKELEVLKLNKDLATSQLTALKAQMNPHFIFNALNSVQQYILQGNVIEANKYLSKFSKLQREILNYSTQNFISLQKEMGTLQLYLELEQLRFAENFSFTITKDEVIDEEEIKIPPMIIQPFIENAIWHGLMPKVGYRFVKVNFSLPKEDQLVCTIVDNGIGREAAARLKQSGNTDPEHKSKGLSLVYDRLNILQAQYGKPFNATITDLVNNDGSSNGTMVILTIYLDF